MALGGVRVTQFYRLMQRLQRLSNPCPSAAQGQEVAFELVTQLLKLMQRLTIYRLLQQLGK